MNSIMCDVELYLKNYTKDTYDKKLLIYVNKIAICLYTDISFKFNLIMVPYVIFLSIFAICKIRFTSNYLHLEVRDDIIDNF